MLVGIETRGFNIVYGNVRDGWLKYYQHQNRADGVKVMKEPIKLENGKVYGLSNGGIDEWDKVIRGTHMFTEIVKQAE